MSKKDKPTLGQSISDSITRMAGSWIFIIIFVSVMALWIIINTVAYTGHFDPYPYILLNLILSTIAALQAPLIMMSQNRQADIDRQRAIEDHELNKKINMKLDAILRAESLSLAGLQEIGEKLEDIEEDLDGNI